MKNKLAGLVFLFGFLIFIPVLIEMEWIPNNYLGTNKDKSYIFFKNIITQDETSKIDNLEYNDLPLTDSNDGLIDGSISDSYEDWFKQPEYDVIYLN